MTAIKTGARGPILVEHPINVKRVYSVIWRRSKLDLTELARQRWVNKWSVSKLAKHFDRSPETVQMHLCGMRKSKVWLDFALSKKELEAVRNNISSAFKGIK